MKKPKNTVVVATYAEFERYAHAFAQQHLNLMIILGDPGLAKTRMMRQAVGRNACVIEGHATPFAAYKLLFLHRHQPIVIDDADSLFQNPQGVRLMKTLCQTEAVKRIAWQSDTRSLKEDDIPQSFETNSKVAIVANNWRPRTPDVAALEDRGHIFLFKPSPLEVHVRTATWFWCQEIFDFIGANLDLIVEPSMRHYVMAWELRQAGLDWKGLILARFLKEKTLMVARLKIDPSFASEEDRADAFVAAGGGSRSTYFAHAKKLQPVTEVPRIVLKHTEPPAAQQPTPDVLEELRKRYGDLGSG